MTAVKHVHCKGSGRVVYTDVFIRRAFCQVCGTEQRTYIRGDFGPLLIADHVDRRQPAATLPNPDQGRLW